MAEDQTVKARKASSNRTSRLRRLFSKRAASPTKARKRLLEQLESRQLMAVDAQPWTDGLYYPPLGLYAGDLTKLVPPAEYARRSAATYGSGNSSGESSDSGEGNLNPLSVAEQESNNTLAQAQAIPVGTVAGKFQTVNIVGSLGTPNSNNFDEDYFRMDLQAGDIFDVIVTGQPTITFDVSLLDSRGRLVATKAIPAARNDFFTGSVGYPTTSPLSTGGNASFAHIVPESGTYYVRISDGTGSYNARVRALESTYKKETVGTKQIIFVDFDGATFRREIFGVPGTARLSPLSSFLPLFNLQDTDEDVLINLILAEIQENYQGSLASLARNGYYSLDGVPGHFDIEIRNSRDHADPWGLPNVSRIIIGGGFTELGIFTRGIAQSIDVGNFDRQETAVVLPEAYFFEGIDFIPRAGTATLAQALGKAIGNTASHEMGHFFGAWHQDNSNNIRGLMDSGGLPLDNTRMGVGPDGIFGTPDDIDHDFSVDAYDFFGSAGHTGVNDTAAVMAFGLSTGTVGGTVTGMFFSDANRNGVKDANEGPMVGFLVYADLNNNGLLEVGEPRTTTKADGTYAISLAAGTYTLRNGVPAGWRATNPVSGSQVASVGLNGVTSGVNFGFEQINNSATGFKWQDNNGNGIRDAGEPALSGVWIYLDLDGDNRIDLNEPQTRTGADGSYRLNFPAAGTYTIREVLDPGFVQTYPAGPQEEHTVFYDGKTPVAGFDFGNRVSRDFGDLPLVYPTMLGNNAASHGFVSGYRLGTIWDGEIEGQFSGTALGDDINGAFDSAGVLIDDEDGVVLSRPIVAGRSDNRLQITVTNTTDSPGILQGWIDFNNDGDFADAGEQIITNATTVNGVNSFAFAAPAGALLGDRYARFRLSDQTNLGVAGAARMGEVEDYAFRVNATLEIAVDDTFEVNRNSIANSLTVLANDFRIPGETLTIVSATSTAAGGIVQVAAGGQTLAYTPPQGFVGRDSFSYTMVNSTGDRDTATVFVDVVQRFVDPIAVDDSFDVPVNAISVPLSVLANDIEGVGGALSIVGVSSGSAGGVITIAPGAQAVRYTPLRDFGGTEQFTYTAADATGKTTTGTVTVHTLPGDRTNDIVGITLVTTDTAGNVISSIRQGQQFQVRVLVDDLRNDQGQNVVAPGVFAAFLDLLYSSGLVAPAAPDVPNPNSGLDFKVQYSNDYGLGRRGSAAIPGIINDLGAFYGSPPNTPNPPPPVMNSPNPVELARLTFTASAPGLAEFVGDPADSPPFTDVLLYNTPNTPIPVSQVRFNRTTIEIVGNSVEFPTAVDDALGSSVSSFAVDFPINVLANDNPGSTNSIRIRSVTQPASGSVRIFDNNTPTNFADDSILYTATPGFVGTEQFSYTVQDLRGFQSTARVTLQVGDSSTDDQVSLRLEVTNESGTPITEVTAGSRFQLRGYVQDLRSPGALLLRGVFAAYQDVLINKNLVTPVATSSGLGFNVTFAANYTNFRSGDILTSGLINEIGSFQSVDGVPQTTEFDPLGSGEFLQFIVTLTANSIGTAQFIGDPADISPAHDTLTFQPAATIPLNQIRFGFDSVNIVAPSGGGNGEGFTNWSNRFDVNNDGFVSPIDALGLINSLNNGGGGQLGSGGGEGEAGKIWFPDVNADGFLSPIDALAVINFLNSGSGGTAGGEGEGEGEGEDSTADHDSIFGEMAFPDDEDEDEDDQLLASLAVDLTERLRRK